MTTTTQSQAPSTTTPGDGRQPGSPTERAFAACIRANVPVTYESLPGQGKSSAVEAMLTSWGYQVTVITGANRDATDFLGLPASDNGFTTYLDIKWAAQLNEACEAGGKAALVIDEFRNVDESLMRAYHRVLQERYVGELKLHDDVVIVGLMNPVDVSTGGVDLPSAVANRVAHLDWKPSLDTWLEGFMFGFDTTQSPAPELLAPGGDSNRLRVRSLLASYVKMNPSHLDAYPADNPVKAAGAWASRRSWTNLADAAGFLDVGDHAALMVLVKGLIGEEYAAPLVQFIRNQDLMDPREAIEHPERIRWDVRADRVYALGNAICALVEIDGGVPLWTKAVKAVTTGVESGRIDSVWMIAQRLLNNRPQDARVPAETVTAFSDRMIEAGLIAAA